MPVEVRNITELVEVSRRPVVYLLAAVTRTYVGATQDLERRLRQHNGELKGGAKYTKSQRPWRVVLVVCGFRNFSEALMFEWAWKHAAPISSSTDELYCSEIPQLRRRNLCLQRVLTREQWTKRAPPSSERNLIIHILAN